MAPKWKLKPGQCSHLRSFMVNGKRRCRACGSLWSLYDVARASKALIARGYKARSANAVRASLLKKRGVPPEQHTHDADETCQPPCPYAPDVPSIGHKMRLPPTGVIESSAHSMWGHKLIPPEYVGILEGQHRPVGVLSTSPVRLEENRPDALYIDYTNWKNVRQVRVILPLGIQFMRSVHHPEPVWVINALDIAKAELRSFAIGRIHSAMSRQEFMRSIAAKVSADLVKKPKRRR